MAFDSKGLDDYVDVAQRIADFRAHYPEGSLQPLNPQAPFEIREVKGTGKNGQEFTATFIVYVAVAYRDRDDPRPGVGMAWEVFPGRTPYTLGSELMNAETSAWGRAIIAALASDSKRGVSSREEVRNRQAERDETPPPVRSHHADTPWNYQDRAEPRASTEDLDGIKAAYAGLGFDPRTDALRVLHVSEQLVGHALGRSGNGKGKTHKNLSQSEARKLRTDLESFNGDRGALMERLTGVTQAAEATAAQDAAEGTQEEAPVPP